MLLVIAALLAASSAAKQPHIVFILADDYGFNDISYHARKNGNDTNIIETPNMVSESHPLRPEIHLIDRFRTGSLRAG